MSTAPVFVIIYGLFKGRRCRYIGQTINYWDRMRTHRSSGILKRFRKLKPRILSRCNESIGALVENALIAHYKRKGGCDLNHKRSHNPARRETMANVPVINETAELRFISISHAAYYYGCTAGVVKTWIKCGPNQWQPERFSFETQNSY